MKKLIGFLGLLLPLTLSAQTPFTASFSPSEGIVPNPINLLFTGSTDGTINIPFDPADPSSAPIQALNALDGFSTVAPISTRFSAAIDSASVVAGDTVRVFEVAIVNPFLDPATTAPFTVTGVNAELIGNQDFFATVSAVDPTQSTLAIVPLKPLKPKTGYMVVLTDGIRATDGSAAFPDATYIFARYQKKPLLDANGASVFARLSDAQAQALEPIRQIVVAQEDAAAAAGMRKGSIVLSWSFTTQSTVDVLQAVRASATAQVASMAATGLSTADLGLGLPGVADIYAGTLQVPYFLEAPGTDPTVVLRTHWRGINDSHLTQYNPQPIATTTLTIPLLATLPNISGKPATGWPLVIFQHGITRNRTDLLAVADALAAIGFAAVAFDLPLHGVTDTSSAFYAGAAERTFNLDLADNTSNATGPDGIIDSSGTYFINLTSLLTSRDNLRQSVADLLHLAATVPSLDLEGDGLADIDPNQIHFAALSLGGIVGTVFLALEDSIGAVSLHVTGGGIPKLLDGSVSFGPAIRAGLAAAGLTPGTPSYESFFAAAQTAVDSGDPINYAALAADLHPIHMTEVVGSATSPSDLVVPNSVTGAPLSGTEPLISAMQLTATDLSAADANGLRAIVRFISGAHGSLLDPSADPAVTFEMQSEMASFLASAGTTLVVTDSSVILPLPMP